MGISVSCASDKVTKIKKNSDDLKDDKPKEIIQQISKRPTIKSPPMIKSTDFESQNTKSGIKSPPNIKSAGFKSSNIKSPEIKSHDTKSDIKSPEMKSQDTRSTGDNSYRSEVPEIVFFDVKAPEKKTFKKVNIPNQNEISNLQQQTSSFYRRKRFPKPYDFKTIEEFKPNEEFPVKAKLCTESLKIRQIIYPMNTDHNIIKYIDEWLKYKNNVILETPLNNIDENLSFDIELYDELSQYYISSSVESHKQAIFNPRDINYVLYLVDCFDNDNGKSTGVISCSERGENTIMSFSTQSP